MSALARPYRFFISILLAGGLLTLLLVWSDLSPARVWQALGDLGWGVWVGSLALQGMLYLLRAQRLRALLTPNGPRPIGGLMAVSVTHTLMAYLLPARLGEATLPLYLAKGLGRSKSEGAAILLLVRLLDFACLTGTMSVVCLMLGTSLKYPELTWLTPLGFALLVPATLFLVLILRSSLLIELLAGMLSMLKLGRWPMGRRALEFTELVGKDVRQVGGLKLLVAGAWTLPLWFGIFSFWGWLAVRTGLADLGLLEATFGSSLTVLSTLVPLNAFAGVGFQDAGFAFGFGVLGADPTAAAASAIATHLVYTVNLLMYGVIGQIFMPRGAETTSP